MNPTSPMAADKLREALADPFEPSEIKWKAQVVRGNRALTVAYIDARCVEDRLDEVLGPGGWQDSFQLLPNNSVVCSLSCYIGGQWIEKTDVGSQSDQPDEGDRVKSAFSDALKRAAVKFGIGRYLYRLPSQWVDYDTQTRQLKSTPKLPAWAIKHTANAPKSAATTAVASNGKAEPAAEHGRSEFMVRDEWDRIKKILTAKGVSQKKFLKHFGVEKPGEIPGDRVQEAMELANAAPKELLGKDEPEKKESAA